MDMFVWDDADADDDDGDAGKRKWVATVSGLNDDEDLDELPLEMVMMTCNYLDSCPWFEGWLMMMDLAMIHNQ